LKRWQEWQGCAPRFWSTHATVAACLLAYPIYQTAEIGFGMGAAIQAINQTGPASRFFTFFTGVMIIVDGIKRLRDFIQKKKAAANEKKTREGPP
jgi:hypothetical protein